MSSFPCSDKAVKNEKRDLWSRHAKLSACQIRDYLSKGKGKVAHEPQEAHTGGAYPCFCSMKQLRVLLLPLDGMPVHRRVTPQQYFASTHFIQETARWQGLSHEPPTIRSEVGALTTTPPRPHRDYLKCV